MQVKRRKHNTKRLHKLLEYMKESQKTWCEEGDISDAEDMWIEYPEFLEWAVPLLEDFIKETENN